jgi:hypothetical protein
MMRVAKPRWGEVTVKKQGEKKNIFDKTKSFSIEESPYEYTLEEMREAYKLVTDLTQKYKSEELKEILERLRDEKYGRKV